MFLALMVASGGCDDSADPRTVRGMMGYAAAAAAGDDASRLFRVVDARARHAMVSIVADRHRAARIIAADYPEELREAALEQLGDARLAEDAEALFAARCGSACRQEIAASVGAPETQQEQGDELVVHTVRGETLRLHRAAEGEWWGIVWQTEALDGERDRANRDLRTIEGNAETYRRRAQLERSAAPREPSQ